MSRQLPYFQFDPAQHLSGDIMICSLAAQGLFYQICSHYWQNDCFLTLDRVKKQFKNQKLLEELIAEHVIKEKKGKIKISFLDKQFSERLGKSAVNKENGKKGAEARWQKNSQAIKNDSIKIRRDKIREEEIKEKVLLKKEPKNLLSENKISDVPDEEKEFFQIALACWNLIRENGKTLKVDWSSLEKAKYKTWVTPIRFMFEQDKRNKDDLLLIFELLKTDNFWMQNIRSTEKLREKFEQLLTKAKTQNHVKPNGNKQNKQPAGDNREFGFATVSDDYIRRRFGGVLPGEHDEESG